jgi:hypothetical protein
VLLIISYVKLEQVLPGSKGFGGFGGSREDAQTIYMYIYVSKCKSDKMKGERNNLFILFHI